MSNAKQTRISAIKTDEIYKVRSKDEDEGYEWAAVASSNALDIAIRYFDRPNPEPQDDKQLTAYRWLLGVKKWAEENGMQVGPQPTEPKGNKP